MRATTYLAAQRRFHDTEHDTEDYYCADCAWVRDIRALRYVLAALDDADKILGGRIPTHIVRQAIDTGLDTEVASS